MEKRLSNKKQMIDTVVGVLDNYNSTWATLAPFARNGDRAERV